jgi:hypothetical protein
VAINTVPPTVAQFESAHRAAGAFTGSIREAASRFFGKLDDGSAFTEARLKLRLAFSSASRAEMSRLKALICQPKGAGSQDLAELRDWMTRNGALMGAMSPESRHALESIGSRQGDARRIDDEIHRAEAALRRAFNPTEQAVRSLALQALSAGAVQESYTTGIRKVSQRLSAALLPGAGKALSELGKILSDPALDETARRDAVAAWRNANPRVDSMLLGSEKGYRDLGWLLTDLARVGDWVDAETSKARTAVMTAFDKAQGP